MFAVSILTLNAQTNITYDDPWHYITSPHGQVYIGPANQHGAHIYTGMPRFYFNKPIYTITGEFSAYSQTDLQLQTAGITRITAKKSTGNVGIGTTSPAEKLHINGAIRGNQAGGALRISTEHGIVDVGAKNGSFCHFYTDLPRFYLNKELWVNSGNIGSYDEDLSLQIAGSTKMTILKSNGNVGIGTDSPENALDVAGTIRAEKCIVELGWADYVLYDDYDLPTLEEEEKYIEENGHLLGFESEEDMAGEIQLGEVSKRQQVKIEEIMLHLIDIKKEVVKSKNEIAELNEEIVELKKENEQLKEQTIKN